MASEDGILMVFHLPEGSSTAQHRNFRRRIYGEETSSWEGRYRYHRKGILDTIPHIRLYWGIIIVEKVDAPGLIRVIEENRGIVITRVVRLESSDKTTLDR
jgi:hypothetical protein